MDSMLEKFDRWSGGIMVLGIIAVVVLLIEMRTEFALLRNDFTHMQSQAANFVTAIALQASEDSMHGRIGRNADDIESNRKRLASMEALALGLKE